LFYCGRETDGDRVDWIVGAETDGLRLLDCGGLSENHRCKREEMAQSLKAEEWNFSVFPAAEVL
jgi:hypothetical protein